MGRSAASASTASSGSASTGRAYSGPPSICAASPVDRSPSPTGLPALSPGCSSLPSFPRGHPSRRPPMVVRTVPRTPELQHDEDDLINKALVILVLGTRPSFAPYQVRRFIQDNFGVAGADFTLHRYYPEDFLVVFRNASDLRRVLEAPPLPRADMILRFHCWNRLSTADAEVMRYRVLLEIRGFPAHAWSAASAQALLGDACAVPELTPTTAARADLRRFQTVIWCSDPDLIPNAPVIRIPEKVDDFWPNNLFLWLEEIKYHELRFLRYNVEIEILEIHDWNDSGSSDGGGTLPDRVLSDSDSDEDYPGFDLNLRSHPWPRRTVFRTLGYGDGACYADGGDGAPASATGNAADACAPTVSACKMASRSLSCPLWFGSLGYLCHPPGTSRHHLVSNDDAATLVCIDRGEVHNPDHADPMLLELTVRLQPVAAPCRDFDPMFAEADAAGRAPRVEVGRAHVGRLELASFTEPPGAVPEEVVATPAAECIAQTLAELEPVRFDVQGSPSVLRTTIAELRNGRTNSGVAYLPNPPDFAAAATGIHRQAQREAHKEVAPPCHEARLRMKKLGITSDSRPPDASSFQQFMATFSSTLTPAHYEALDALLPTGMGSLATEVVAPMMVY
ncbi:hypothetical protein PVAP13_8NG182104 [Panicum virgatum]|uniref:DUF4283 domain-containing protein n=1 Tax=Panicum virgatum TaxID=38727 RepID=A0A8T0PFA1_PANVG|nr:hypothetical protein PVAP13_8NG182104 [Panicum virgatum]